MINPFYRTPGQLTLRDLEMRLVTRLSSFALLGLDMKRTEGDGCKVIEVNGIHSGMKGFGLADVAPIMTYPMDCSDVLPPPSPDSNPCERSLDYYLNTRLGSRAAHFIFKAAERYGTSLPHLACYIEDIQGEQALSDATLPLMTRLLAIEEILSDKLKTDAFFQELREWKPQTYSTITSLLEAETSAYVVRKPRHGARGEGVEIFIREHAYEVDELPGTVVESFIHSKPLLYPVQGTYHDGCMRYVVVVEDSTTTGKIEITHFGGYWRLCPLPLDQYGHIDAMRANLAQGAIAQRASPEDLRIVKEAVDTFVPRFYERLVEACVK